MSIKKRWGRKLSVPAVRVQSQRGWDEGVRGAEELISQIHNGEIGPEDVGVAHMPTSKAEVEDFVDKLLDCMDLDGLTAARYDELWDITDVRVEVFALAYELTRALEADVTRGHWSG